jgi:hypothetical protein
LLSSLTALVLHDFDIKEVSLLALPRLKSLQLVLNTSPLLLNSLQCGDLELLKVALEETSREGWWDLLTYSVAFH